MKKFKHKINLKEFILTGKFGNIEVGMTREQIIYLLGKPEWYGLGNDTSEMTADMWTYGDIEFYFAYNPPGENRLGMIFRDNLISGINGGKYLKISPWILKNKRLTLKKALKLLHKKQISFEKNDELIVDYLHTTLSFKSGVKILFVKDNYDKISRLENISLHFVFHNKQNV